MPFREQHIGKFRTLASIRMPNVFRVIAWMLIIGFVVGLVFLTFTPWVQTTGGVGRVTALNPNDRAQEISAFVSGRIAEWYVRDGSPVTQGDAIVRIEDNDPQLLNRLGAERQQVEAKLAAAESRLETAQIDLRRVQSLFERGLTSRREVELAQIKVQDFLANVAEANAEMSRIDVSITRQAAQIVTAPRDGVILRVNAGDTSTFIGAGAVVATFVPLNVERAVEIFVDGRDVSLVRPGQKARVEFEGWPAVQFSGWPSVAVGTFGARVVSIDPSADQSGMFRVLLVEDPEETTPWPDESYIRFGAAVRGWVLLETVSVGYEIWRQMNNFPPEFAANAGAGGGNSRGGGAGNNTGGGSGRGAGATGSGN